MKVSGLVRLAGCLSCLLLGILALASPPAGHYHLVNKAPRGLAPAGGREYFDYLTVDSQARRVYASHGTEVKVADADSGAVVGTISGLKQGHGIALVGGAWQRILQPRRARQDGHFRYGELESDRRD